MNKEKQDCKKILHTKLFASVGLPKKVSRICSVLTCPVGTNKAGMGKYIFGYSSGLMIFSLITHCMIVTARLHKIPIYL